MPFSSVTVPSSSALRGSAAEELASRGIQAAVVNLPWLNRIDEAWVTAVLAATPLIVTLDNHYVSLGQGVMVAAALARTGTRTRVLSIGLTDVPACGANVEVLAHHGLDGPSIAAAVVGRLERRAFQ